MKFMRMCMNEVMKAANGEVGVIVKTNMRDGFRGGIEIEEGIKIAQELEQLGADALVLSGGFVSKAPMYVMRGPMPIKSMTYYMHPWWLKYGVKLVGKWMIPTVPYSETYFLDDALEFRKALKLPLIYVGGCSTRTGIDRVLDKGFEFVQMGRALLRCPDFVNRMAAGALPGQLTAGHKKDIVITNRIAGEPGRLFIYGWHYPDGKAHPAAERRPLRRLCRLQPRRTPCERRHRHRRQTLFH